jgi:hypothetical protein
VSATANDVARAFTDAARCELSEGLSKIEHCLNQLTDEQVWWRPRPEMNSIANLLLHLAGNLRQWIVSGVGGAADVRHRPGEFADRSAAPKSEVLAKLRGVIHECGAVLARLSPDDLVGHTRIQGYDLTRTGAVLHAVPHFRGHVQEIIHMTRAQLGERYKFDFVPTTPEQIAAGGAKAI